MTAASNSESRKRNAAQVDPVEIVARAIYDSMALVTSIAWGDRSAEYKTAFYDDARSYVAALRAEGLLS